MGIRITGHKDGHKCFTSQPLAVDRYPTRREIGTEAVCDECGREWVVKSYNPDFVEMFTGGRRKQARNVWVPRKR